jgi:tyrosine-protein phosphatase YwqE
MASDAHSPRARPPNLHAAFKKLTSLTGETRAERIMFEASMAVIEGKKLIFT